jgi:hypothetical protein
MRKTMIIPAMALSLMSLGAIAGVTPAGAHQAVHTGEDGDSTTVTVPSGGGGSSSGASSGGSSGGSATPSGGISTGAGGTAVGHENDLTPWLATGAAGIALVGVSAATRRRRAVKA